MIRQPNHFRRTRTPIVVSNIEVGDDETVFQVFDVVVVWSLWESC